MTIDNSILDAHGHEDGLKIGLWIIAGLLSFMIIEKIFMEEEKCREILEVYTLSHSFIDSFPKTTLSFAFVV